jgi:hypothetical protein
MTQAQTQTQIQSKTLKIDKSVLELAEGLLQKLNDLMGCNAKPIFDEFKTLDDIVARLTDVDAWNEYSSSCAYSAQKFLQAVALMASLCHYSAATDTGVNEAICEKFYAALGEFIVSRDARSFLILDQDYSD